LRIFNMFVIPVINETSFEAIAAKIKKVEPYTQWVQIDVGDGVFTPNQTWNNPGDLLRLDSPINIEVHLMIKNPELVLESWLRIPLVKRALIHLEATTAMEKIINLGEEFEKEIGIVINPETPVSGLGPYLNEVNFFQMLAVKPGLAGQEFQPEVINKIKALKLEKNDVIIEVDGGVTPENAKLLKEAGADILNSATYIFNSQNIQEAIANLNV